MFDASTAELLAQLDLLGSSSSDASRSDLSFQECARRKRMAAFARGHTPECAASYQHVSLGEPDACCCGRQARGLDSSGAG